MKKRILIVDGDIQMRETLAKNLACWGYTVVTASDGTEAWALLQEPDAPRIVLLDAAVEGVGSLELCRRVRDLRGDDNFLLVAAADASKTDPLEALEAGADGVIAKPIHLRELRMRLAAGIRGRRLAALSAPPRPSLSVARAPALSGDRPFVGSIVGGKYRIVRLLGNGGMGTVWQGIHVTLGIRVAVKFIRTEYVRHSLARARFELEAKATARLRTRYAVRMLDYGVTDGGLPYLVMEYLEGPSLLRHVQTNGPLSFEHTARLITQAAHALEESHAHGTIHRDVKPDNILLVADPDATEDRAPFIPKLIDFGVAKVLAQAHDESSSGTMMLNTQAGIVIGTPNFMTPEQLHGASLPDVDSDLWALAACAFTAITGCIPFEGATMAEVVRRVCNDPLPVPSRANMQAQVPAEFDAWFARACSRDASKRFTSAREMATALTEAYAEYAHAQLDMTPSLKSFVSDDPHNPTTSVRRVFDLEAPTLSYG